MAYVTYLTTDLDNNSASEFTHDLEKCKNLIARIVKRVELEELRFRLNEESTFWASAEKGDLSHFMRRSCAL